MLKNNFSGNNNLPYTITLENNVIHASEKAVEIAGWNQARSDRYRALDGILKEIAARRAGGGVTVSEGLATCLYRLVEITGDLSVKTKSLGKGFERLNRESRRPLSDTKFFDFFDDVLKVRKSKQSAHFTPIVGGPAAHLERLRKMMQQDVGVS